MNGNRFSLFQIIIYKANVRVSSSREHPARANPGHLMHEESRGPVIWQLIMSRPPGHLQTTKNLLRNILSSFLAALRVGGFKHRHFGIRIAFIDHKRPIKSIKPFALSLFIFSRSDSLRDLFYIVLLS